jgi:hypothetical protein
MANADVAAAHFEIGRVITRAFGVIGRNFVKFFVLSAILTVPILVFTFFSFFVAAFGLHFTPLPLGTPGSLAVIVTGAVAGVLVYFIFTNLLQAAITHGTIVSLNGGNASFADCFATGIRNALPLTAITVLAALGIMGGALLLLVPGIIFSLMWAVIMPVRVAEHTPILQTFGRSAELTSGSRWSIFLLNIIVGILAVALDLVIRPLAGVAVFSAATASVPVTLVALTALVRIVTYMVGATMVASIYYELRLVKEGVGPEQLAAVFS